MTKWILAPIFFLSLQTYAYIGSVNSATGNAGTAAVEASETPYTNPAGMSFLRGYYFTAGFGMAHQNAVGNSQDLAISLSENMKETIVPTAFSYNQESFRGDAPAGVQMPDDLRRELKLSVANFLMDQVSVGFGLHHVDDRLDRDSYQQTNGQVGVLWAPNRNLGFAAVFDNLVGPNTDIPEAYRLNQTTELGMTYNYKRFVRVKADIGTGTNNSFVKPVLGAGMESFMNRWMVLRWGFQKDVQQETNLYTAGLGFIGPRFGLNYAYQNSPQDETLTRHSVDLAIPIW